MVRREIFLIPPIPPPVANISGKKFLGAPFQYPKVPLEAGAPNSFDTSYAPELIFELGTKLQFWRIGSLILLCGWNELKVYKDVQRYMDLKA